ncbi:sensor domain-containing diguanylate cyclase [Tsukamurella sp. 8F]|uniref:sensor domain-containing diguanylate cyclase n=1 Tax=unclassified Tsukamurella TaxID=2633480 RepID=UPI0023BA26E7|nr:MULTISPECIES: sensor domain-containing diguanylate cyclase [unclassified Tsukamurella]MDF0531262.1 sensor domain-containing diguanylate cyclase [Tsukamurella sp. 8J]MDF0585211.1 sensor domain-containing diguanylate cyclase [Tsukamurella sp. 8F]
MAAGRRAPGCTPTSSLGGELYQKAFRHADCAMALHSADRRFVDANEAFVEMLGYSRAELLGMTVSDVVHPDEQDESARWAAQWLAGVRKGAPAFGRVVCKDGSVVAVRVRKTVVSTEQGLFALATLEQLGAQSAFERDSHYDELTGLLNRRGLRRALRTSYPSDLRVTVVLVDIDRFKAVNDRFGHAAGDLVLASVAKKLAHAAPDHALVARWSGDEFVVCIPGGSDLGFLSDDLRRRNDDEGLPPLSVGTTEFSPVAETIDSALVRADDAMYRDKFRDRPMRRLLAVLRGRER